MRTRNATILSLFLLLALSTSSLFANAWTPFVENLEVGKTATHHCKVIPSGFDKEWEYFTVVVHSDTGMTYGLRGKAKPGVVDLDKIQGLFGSRSCKVTAKLLKREGHKSGRLVSVELEISAVEFLPVERGG